MRSARGHYNYGGKAKLRKLRAHRLLECMGTMGPRRRMQLEREDRVKILPGRKWEAQSVSRRRMGSSDGGQRVENLQLAPSRNSY